MKKIYAAFAKLFVLSLLFSFSYSPVHSQGNGNHLSYDGVDDYLRLPSGSILSNLHSFTIEAWVYWRGGSTSFPRIFEFGNDANNFLFLTAAIPFGNQGPRFAIVSGGIAEVIDATTTLPVNAWAHIAVTLNHSTSTGTMYINGTAVGTTTDMTLRPAYMGSTDFNWLGGRGQYTDPYFSGNIEEFRISNNVRYSGSFAVTSQFSTDANTIVLYHFNEGTGQTTADASGNFMAATRGASTAVESSDPSWKLNPILPIKFRRFTAQPLANHKGVDLQWVASFDKTASFEIERSLNGTDFVHAGTIQATAATDGQTFAFRDRTPFTGTAYYRIKGVETGRQPVLSQVLAVIGTARTAFQVYPNPVSTGSYTLLLQEPFQGEVVVQLYHTSGRLVQQQKLLTNGNRELTLLRGVSVPAGTYVVKLKAGQKEHSQTLIFQ